MYVFIFHIYIYIYTYVTINCYFPGPAAHVVTKRTVLFEEGYHL